jgi:adenine/guanine phosphoribosyltransferase-like PRPP-binding protein
MEHNIATGPCSIKAMRVLVKKFEETGCVCDAPQSGRPPTTVETVSEIRQKITENAAINSHGISNACLVSQELGLPWSTVRKVLRKTLHMFLYKIKKLHQLQPNDYEMRLDMARYFIARIQVDDGWMIRFHTLD